MTQDEKLCMFTQGIRVEILSDTNKEIQTGTVVRILDNTSKILIKLDAPLYTELECEVDNLVIIKPPIYNIETRICAT